MGLLARRYLRIAAPPLVVVWVVLVLWGLTLVFVDWGALLVARHPFVLVRHLQACQLARTPDSPEIAAHVDSGLLLQVRDYARTASELCYRVRTAAGQEGWFPYNPSFVESAGFFWGWRELMVPSFERVIRAPDESATNRDW